MAHWFFQIFVWYGLVTQFHEASCLRNSWSRKPTSQETSFGQKLQNRSLQDNKNFLTTQSVILSDIKDRPKGLNPLHLKDGEDWLYKHIVGKQRTERKYNTSVIASNITKINRTKSKPKGNLNNRKRGLVTNTHSSAKKSQGQKPLDKSQTNKTKHRRDILTAQVPDDDIEDNGSTFSDEISLKVLVEPPKSLKYFLRNNKKLLVKEDWKASNNYYNKLNKHTFDDIGIDSSERANDLSDHIEMLLHREDALEKPNDEGPTFKDSMIWVNMMRADRGWFPKESRTP